ncbi:hypothetical protein BKA80DRAFT_253025 [Phyllosticta citrichinensis]
MTARIQPSSAVNVDREIFPIIEHISLSSAGQSTSVKKQHRSPSLTITTPVSCANRLWHKTEMQITTATPRVPTHAASASASSRPTTKHAVVVQLWAGTAIDLTFQSASEPGLTDARCLLLTTCTCLSMWLGVAWRRVQLATSATYRCFDCAGAAVSGSRTGVVAIAFPLEMAFVSVFVFVPALRSFLVRRESIVHGQGIL